MNIKARIFSGGFENCFFIYSWFILTNQNGGQRLRQIEYTDSTEQAGISFNLIWKLGNQ